MGRVDKAGKPEFRAREASEKRGAVWGGISDERACLRVASPSSARHCTTPSGRAVETARGCQSFERGEHVSAHDVCEITLTVNARGGGVNAPRRNGLDTRDTGADTLGHTTSV